MTCTSCGQVVTDYPSTLGRNITGRSAPGQDVRYQYQNGIMVPVPVQEMPTQPKKLAIDWGAFVAGAVVGGIIVAVLVTATGRSLAGAAGQRVTHYIRGK